jgi:hypothetical protein
MRFVQPGELRGWEMEGRKIKRSAGDRLYYLDYMYNDFRIKSELYYSKLECVERVCGSFI